MSNELHPFEISFKNTPRARMVHRWVRFASNAEVALEQVKPILEHEYRDFHCQVQVRPAGIEAEAEVNGVIRGGYLFPVEGPFQTFYYHDPEPRTSHVGECRVIRTF